MAKLSESRKTSLGVAADKFHSNLDEASWAYLSARGITEDMVEAYNLGLVSASSGAKYEPYVGRLSIPFTTPTGVVAIRYRCLEDHDCKVVDEQTGWHKKYLQGKGEGDRLFNVSALHERHPAIAIVEGEIDTMFVDTFVLPAVGLTGVSKWKPYHLRLFEDHDRVFIVGDGDKAGREMVDRLVELLPNGQGVVFPKDYDVNSYYLEHGAEGLTKVILGDSA